MFWYYFRNYNPLERRNKGGKERNIMASQKSSKSLQTNNSQNRTSGDKMNLPKINGELITNTMPRQNMQYLSLYP